MKKIISLVLCFAMMFALAGVAFATDAVQEKPYDNSEFYTEGEYTLHYRVYEPANEVKNQILLVHGFCLSTVSLEGVAQQYQNEGYRVVLVDAPNFGYSSRETTSMQLVAREELIYSLMQSLGGTWIVGGHSMGGGIAINLACDYPETVTGLVLYAPQTAMQATGIMATMSRSFLMQAMYTVILKVALKIPFLVEMLVAMSFSDNEYAKNYELTRISAPLSLEGTGAGISIMASHARGNDFEKLSTLDIPCVIITAANDKVASADNLSEIIGNAPEGTYTYEFSDGGHMMMEYYPEETANQTLATIAKCK